MDPMFVCLFRPEYGGRGEMVEEADLIFCVVKFNFNFNLMKQGQNALPVRENGFDIREVLLPELSIYIPQVRDYRVSDRTVAF